MASADQAIQTLGRLLVCVQIIAEPNYICSKYLDTGFGRAELAELAAFCLVTYLRGKDWWLVSLAKAGSYGALFKWSYGFQRDQTRDWRRKLSIHQFWPYGVWCAAKTAVTRQHSQTDFTRKHSKLGREISQNLIRWNMKKAKGVNKCGCRGRDTGNS